jgi:hypothetical protein
VRELSRATERLSPSSAHACGAVAWHLLSGVTLARLAVLLSPVPDFVLLYDDQGDDTGAAKRARLLLDTERAELGGGGGSDADDDAAAGLDAVAPAAGGDDEVGLDLTEFLTDGRRRCPRRLF